MMIALILAVLMTMITASSQVILKKGFAGIQPFAAVYISVVISTFFLWGAVLIAEPVSTAASLYGILIFIIIGSFAPTIVRTLTYYGIHTLGAGRAAPLRAMTPFFATLFAIFFLHESPRSGIFIGIFLIIAGVTLLMTEGKREKVFSWKPLHMVYPLGAALLAGIAANLRKHGLCVIPQPIFASAIAATSSLFFLTLYACVSSPMATARQYLLAAAKFSVSPSFAAIKKIFYKKEWFYIVSASLLTSLGEIVDLSALLYGTVTLVVPVFAATPLVIMLLSHLFLKKHEKITIRLVFGSLLILCGVYLSVINALPMKS